MFTRLHIEYANPLDLHDSVIMEFRLREYPIVERWAQKLLYAQGRYELDDPTRFYGFGNIEDQTQDAINRINACITIINLYKPIVNRTLTDVHDQDTLNYLHNIFEVFHGLLDRQTNPFWHDAPDSVRLALADLNVLVHRCESVARGAQPRHVATWYGLPKTDTLSYRDYDLFEYTWRPGTVFLNYAEIGKTMEDLAFDNDLYISDGAFQPFRHYSADFNVKFFEQTVAQSADKRAIITEYYYRNKELFGEWCAEYTIGYLPIADLTTPLDLNELLTRQYVKSVTLT